MSELSMNPKEASERSGIGLNRIYWHCKNDPTFPVFKAGEKYLIHRDRFDQWFANHAGKRSGFKI